MFNRHAAVPVIVLMILTGLLVFDVFRLSYAFDFEPRSVTLSTGVPSAVASHDFVLAPPTTNDIGSIVFEYCSNSPLVYVACTPPAGLDVSSAVLSSQSGNTGFTIDSADSTASKIVLGRLSAPGIMTVSTYNFDDIINPSTPAQTVYVRMTSYASSDGSGSFIDKGTVTFAVQSPFSVNTYVPPFLRLCVGITVAPDCSSMSGDSIDLGILSASHASAGQSQFATATNDPNGYIVYALGSTMTSGNNIIPALSNPSASFPGTGQFGINLRANLIPAIGQDPFGTGTAAPTANYDLADRFMFNSGDAVASSTLNTDYNRMTVSYLANIPSKQIPGIYATTITYVATVQF